MAERMFKPIAPKKIFKKRRFSNMVGAGDGHTSSTSEAEYESDRVSQPSSNSNSDERSRPKFYRRKVFSKRGALLQCTVSMGNGSERGSGSSGSGTSFCIATNLYELLEEVYKTRRDEIISEDGFMSTPLHVLKQMSKEWKTAYHAEIFVITFEGESIYRIEIFVGKLRGIGQSPRRKLSFQLAAADVLEKLVFMNNTKLQPYALLPGFRTSPTIYKVLIAFCSSKSLSRPTFTLVEERPYHQWPMYVVECKVGKMTMQEASDSRFLAKRLVAKKMYETLSGECFPEEFILMGSECFGLKELREDKQAPAIIFSRWKTAWLRENRMIENRLVVTSDEPDDGDFGDDEDSVEFESLGCHIEEGDLHKIRRVISNDNIVRVIKFEEVNGPFT